MNSYNITNPTCSPHHQTHFWEHWNNFGEIANDLTRDRASIANWPASRAAIRMFLFNREHDLVGLDNFLKRIVAYGAEIDIDQTLSFISEIIELPLLENVIRHRNETAPNNRQVAFQNALQWARDQQSLYPSPMPSNRDQGSQELWRHLEAQVFSFIPNLLNIFMGAFDFINIHKKYTSLWDKYLLIEIIYKFFIIPSCLVKVLKPVYGTSIKVYVISGMILASLGTFFACYKRWIRPMPSQVVNCVNLSQTLNVEESMRIYGQTAPMQQLIRSLMGEANVLLVGRSGEGKTALIHHLVQLQRRGRLPQDLQDKTFFQFDCTMINSNGTVGYREMINQTFEQIDIERNGKNVVFILDEFSQVLGNPMAFHLIKERFLKDKPPFKFIAALTQEEFSRLIICDQDRSFEREMTTITVDSSEDEHLLRLMLHGLIDRLAWNLPINPDAFSEIIARSNDARFLPNIGRPAKAEKILKDAIGRCRCTYHPNYIPKELSQMYQERGILQREYRAELTSVVLRSPPQGIVQLNQRISTNESQLAINKSRIEKVRSLYESYQRSKENYVRDTHELTRPRVQRSIRENNMPEESAQITYLLNAFYVLDTQKTAFDREIALIPGEIPVQITVELIQQVCNDLSTQEELLHGPTQSRAATSDSR